MRWINPSPVGSPFSSQSIFLHKTLAFRGDFKRVSLIRQVSHVHTIVHHLSDLMINVPFS